MSPQTPEPELRVSHVVAMAENRVIGREGGLPWHNPEDLKLFKALTMGKMLLMGRKTFQAIGRALPGRLTIVVTARDAEGPWPAGVLVCKSLEEAFAAARERAALWQHELCVVGGGEIYRQTLDDADVIHLSLMPGAVQGDTTYPPLPPAMTLQRAEERPGSPPFVYQLWTRAAAEG